MPSDHPLPKHRLRKMRLTWAARTTLAFVFAYFVFLAFLSPCPSSLPTLLNLPAFLPTNDPKAIVPPASCLSRSRIPFLTTYASLSHNIPRTLPPYLPYLHKALSISTTPSPLHSQITQPDTLTIQYSYQFPNDEKFTSHILSFLSTATPRPKAIHILSNHGHPSAARHLHDALQSKSYAPTTLHLLPDPQILSLLHAAPTVFVHRGPMAALSALCATTLYYTQDGLSPFIQENSYKWLLTPDAHQVPPGRVSPFRPILDGMGPVLPSTCRFEAFGHGDGEKIVCTNAQAFKRTECWVLSVGCNGKWSFEEAVVNRTRCSVHTFDCTGEWPVPERLRGRVTLHKYCLGSEDDAGTGFRSWETLVKIGGGGEARMPSLAKIDIEGYEYPVMGALLGIGDEGLLPQQVAMEVHASTGRKIGAPMVWNEEKKQFRASREVVEEFFGNMTSKGYRLVHRADNPFCPHCSEVTMLREDGLPTI
eukprot:GFKZ01000154.1.p1 GENE.GFKZ01000154.1~~GFKZ01000154.1.p1  ORF type:complete len:478 (+),score=46.79 GFKZ01000154.1:258-1691(+)